MKLNKKEIREIALYRFHDKYYESAYDCWTEALEVWLKENGLKIVRDFPIKKAPEAEGEAISDPQDQD